MDEAFSIRHRSNLMTFHLFHFWKGKWKKSKTLSLGKASESVTRSGYFKANLCLPRNK
jgi:hypothetical protein